MTRPIIFPMVQDDDEDSTALEGPKGAQDLVNGPQSLASKNPFGCCASAVEGILVDHFKTTLAPL